MESLFGSNSGNHEATKRSALPPVEQQFRILDPKKSQNIAILLRALNVTRDEVSEALLDGKYITDTEASIQFFPSVYRTVMFSSCYPFQIFLLKKFMEQAIQTHWELTY